MHVRDFTVGDEPAAARVLDAAYGHDPRLRALHGSAHGLPRERPSRRTRIAFVGDDPAALATRVHTSQEPARTWASLVVAPEFRRRGLGTALLREIRARAHGPLRTRAMLADEAAAGFLRAHGLVLLDPSWDARVDPCEVAGRCRKPRLSAPPAPDEAAAFFDRLQAAVHPYDPPVPRTPERAVALFCGEQMVPGSLVGVRDGAGRLVAAANLVRPSGYDPDDELCLVWAGAHESHAEAAEDVVCACVRFAAEAGMFLRFEVGRGNVPLRRALDRLGVLGEPVLGVFGDGGPEPEARPQST